MGNIHVANAVIINPQGKILLTQRYDPKNKNIHLCWQVPGGGIENDETPAAACLREAKEETGLDVEILSDSPFIIEQSYPEVSFHLNVFLTRPISDTIDTTLDEETNDARWFELKEIKKLKTLDDTYEMVRKCIQIWKKHSFK